MITSYLRTNPRTLENWEQGRAKPNAQAALLIRLVALFPDMVGRLELSVQSRNVTPQPKVEMSQL